MSNLVLLMEVGAVTASLALWLFSLLAVADDLLRLVQAECSYRRVFCTIRTGIIAAPFVVAAGFGLTLVLQGSQI